MTDFVREELSKVRTRLAEADPGSEEYTNLLRNIKDLCDIESRLDMRARMHRGQEKVMTPAYVVTSVAEDLGLDTPAPAAVVTPITTEEPAAEEPEEEPKHTYTREEVRAALAESRKRGIKVSEVLGELGYPDFPAVPAGKYGLVMKKLGVA